MLPEGDHTPPDFALPVPSLWERLKRPLRQALYPAYGSIVDVWIRHKGYSRLGLDADFWLWGQRGNDYEALRRRVNLIFPIRGKRVLIAGCGTGRDVVSWLEYTPRFLTGVDYFIYERAWQALRRNAQRRYPGTGLAFRQADLARMSDIPDESIDLIGSDAVFEHLQNLPAVLDEFHRVLRPGGIVYATFGPLWYCWGGDHFSGSADILEGYNHLLLEPEAYKAYLDKAGPHTHSEHDGRTWVEHDLFSYLRPAEYLAAMDSAGFERRQVDAIIEPRAIRCFAQFPEVRERLLCRYKEIDLFISCMTLIYGKLPRAL